MRRPLAIGAVIFAVFLAAVLVFLVLIPSATDARNQRVADEVARNAGIPTSVTPGPGGAR